MDLASFDFDLPSELIAQLPAKPRDHARLLVYERQNSKITDSHFYNLSEFLVPKTTLVLNNSKVDKCRLRAGSTEIFILEETTPKIVRALVRPGRKFSAGGHINFGQARVETLKVLPDGSRQLKFDIEIGDRRLDPYRHTPFPPYIKANERQADQYQTVFSKTLGSKAAPTAGLHFTKAQLKQMAKDFSIAELTLHVGLGTFAPLRPENFQKQKLHAEWFDLDKNNAQKLKQAKHITAIGTTSLRTLESLAQPFEPQSGWTDIFITPGYKFKVVDSLVTNFHLPKSSLIILVAAFIGSIAQTQRLYQHAIENRYRFYSFGDAMLIV